MVGGPARPFCGNWHMTFFDVTCLAREMVWGRQDGMWEGETVHSRQEKCRERWRALIKGRHMWKKRGACGVTGWFTIIYSCPGIWHLGMVLTRLRHRISKTNLPVWSTHPETHHTGVCPILRAPYFPIWQVPDHPAVIRVHLHNIPTQFWCETLGQASLQPRCRADGPLVKLRWVAHECTLLLVGLEYNYLVHV